MKEELLFFVEIDKRLWGDKVNANPFFASLSVLLAAIGGAMYGGGSVLHDWFDWNLLMNPAALGATILLIWCYNVVESILASENWAPALFRPLLILAMMLLAFFVSIALSVIVLFLVAVVLVIWLFSLFIGMALDNGKAKRAVLEDEYGNRIKGTHHGDSFTSNDGRHFSKNSSGKWEED